MKINEHKKVVKLIRLRWTTSGIGVQEKYLILSNSTSFRYSIFKKPRKALLMKSKKKFCCN